MTDPRFTFYEKVIVVTDDPDKETIAGQVGAILGRALESTGAWSYAVWIYSKSEVWGFNEDELVTTGVCANREDFYSGRSVRVLVDDEGTGTIADNKWGITSLEPGYDEASDKDDQDDADSVDQTKGSVLS